MATLKVENGDSAAVRYTVLKNLAQEKLTGKTTYCARVYTKTKSLREVAEAMVREGLNHNVYDVYTMLESFASVVTRMLQEGNAVNVGSLVRFRPSIVGKFASDTENFTRGTHQLKVRASVGSSLRNAISSAPVVRVSAALPLPEILEVYNGKSGTPNTVSNEAAFIVNGNTLTYNDAAEDEGFFLSLDGQELRCEVITGDDKSVVLLVPHTLSEGNEVELIFRTRYSTNGNLITIIYSELLAYEA